MFPLLSDDRLRLLSRATRSLRFNVMLRFNGPAGSRVRSDFNCVGTPVAVAALSVQWP